MDWTAIADFGLGLLGATGQTQTNRMNRDMAREQMGFQERMSNTAAQRSVADYRAAGLNPGLAYDRSASSPSGASATMGDAMGTGINSALRAREMRQSLRQLQANEANVRSGTALNTELARKAKGEADLVGINKGTAEATQPFMKQLAEAQALLAMAQVPGATNTADLERWLKLKAKAGGPGGLGFGTLKGINEILKTWTR